MIASLYQGHDVFAGGVIAAANHLSSFCKDINIITILVQSSVSKRNTSLTKVECSLNHI